MSARMIQTNISQGLPIHITQRKKMTDTTANRIQRVVLTSLRRPRRLRPMVSTCLSAAVYCTWAFLSAPELEFSGVLIFLLSLIYLALLKR